MNTLKKHDLVASNQCEFVVGYSYLPSCFCKIRRDCAEICMDDGNCRVSQCPLLQ